MLNMKHNLAVKGQFPFVRAKRMQLWYSMQLFNEGATTIAAWECDEPTLIYIMNYIWCVSR